MSKYRERPLTFDELRTVPIDDRGGKVTVEHFAKPYQKGDGVTGFIDALPHLLAADAERPKGSSPKSVIMIYLVGGPPHQDMFDLKPDAPKEIAGPWRPIDTNVPGIRICEA